MVRRRLAGDLRASQHTTRLRFLVAFRPGITNPTLAAQQATTFLRMTNGRLLINIVTGGDALEQQRFGDWLSHDERYARTDEFLKVLRGAWSGAPFDFEGWHYKIREQPHWRRRTRCLRCTSAALLHRRGRRRPECRRLPVVG